MTGQCIEYARYLFTIFFVSALLVKITKNRVTSSMDGPNVKVFQSTKGNDGRILVRTVHRTTFAIWATIFLKLYYYYSIVDLFSIEK